MDFKDRGDAGLVEDERPRRGHGKYSPKSRKVCGAATRKCCRGVEHPKTSATRRNEDCNRRSHGDRCVLDKTPLSRGQGALFIFAPKWREKKVPGGENRLLLPSAIGITVLFRQAERLGKLIVGFDRGIEGGWSVCGTAAGATEGLLLVPRVEQPASAWAVSHPSSVNESFCPDVVNTILLMTFLFII